MRIAFLSYEFPPDTAFGGIGTYTFQVTSCLRRMGLQVEVFSASHTRQVNSEVLENGVVVHRVQVSKREQFRERIADLVKQRHSDNPFQLIESP